MEGFLPLTRKWCDNRGYCFLYAHTETDPCPTISKYLEVVYSCEQNGRCEESLLPLFFFFYIPADNSNYLGMLNQAFWFSLERVFCFAVCVRGLGVEDGNVTNSMLSASSFISGKSPAQARLNGASCWMPSTSRECSLRHTWQNPQILHSLTQPRLQHSSRIETQEQKA